MSPVPDIDAQLAEAHRLAKELAEITIRLNEAIQNIDDTVHGDQHDEL